MYTLQFQKTKFSQFNLGPLRYATDFNIYHSFNSYIQFFIHNVRIYQTCDRLACTNIKDRGFHVLLVSKIHQKHKVYDI